MVEVQHDPTELLVGEGDFAFDAVVEAALASVLGDQVAVAFGEEGFDKAKDVGVVHHL